MPIDKVIATASKNKGGFMFKNYTKKVILAVAVMVFGIMCVSNINVKAEVFSGEGKQIQLSEEQDAAPTINFNTQYYIANEDADRGYVKINTEKDGYIRFWKEGGLVVSCYDNAMNEVDDIFANDYVDFERVKAGGPYYLKLRMQRSSDRRFIVEFLEDKAGNTKSDCEQIETNTVHTETIAFKSWRGEDRDCYKVTADVTGNAVLVYTENVKISTSYFNSGIKVESDKDYGDAYIYEYLEVKKGDTYILDVSGQEDYGDEVAYSLIFLTAQVESIEFTPQNVSLNIQEKYQLKPEILPELVVDGRVKYESSNTKVATVDNDGQIFAKSAGKATIFCKAMGSGVEGVFNLTVVNPIGDETASISALTNMGNGAVKANLKKCRYATGYEVEYSTSKSMRNAKSVSFSSTAKKIKGLKKGKKYYFRARGFAIDGNGKRLYSEYSSVRSIKVSKK